MFFRNSLDVTPAATDVDVTALEKPIQCFRVGVTGDLKVQLIKDPANTPVTFKNVQAGEILNIRVKTIVKVGTTAQNIIALW